MRLKPNEINYIKKTVLSYDSKAKIYLFGSRVDDHLQGGDIDLLVLTTKLSLDDKLAIKLKLYDYLGEQKIDLVLANDTTQPFVRGAIAEGIEL